MKYDKHSFDEFKFENGDILKDVAIEYIVKGTPKYDEEGKITNGVVYCHNFNGNASSINDIYQLTGEGDPFDLNEYVIFSVTTLGFPDSCSPSNTELYRNFPKYCVKDRVNFKKQFLKEVFGIEKVHGVIGDGLGGYEVYSWACEYPDDMDFIMVCASSFKTNGYRYVVSKGIDSIIENSEHYYSDVYNDSMTKTMITINKILYSNFYSKKKFQNMSNDEIDVLMDEYVDDGLFIDIYDFKFQNDVILKFNLEDKLKNIKAKSLVISPLDDLYFSPEYDTVPLENLIDDCKIILFDSNVEYISETTYINVKRELESFLEQFKK